jgi:Transglycosylase-like domain
MATTKTLPSWETTTAPEKLSFGQVEKLIRQAGGSIQQAIIGAGIALGVESGGTTQVRAGGIGPAQGLFQFEPETWEEYAPSGSPSTATGATPAEQAAAFVNAVKSDKGYAPWAPDLGYSYPENPTAPAAGSAVAEYLEGIGETPGTTSTATLTAATTSGSTGTTSVPGTTAGGFLLSLTKALNASLSLDPLTDISKGLETVAARGAVVALGLLGVGVGLYIIVGRRAVALAKSALPVA